MSNPDDGAEPRPSSERDTPKSPTKPTTKATTKPTTKPTTKRRGSSAGVTAPVTPEPVKAGSSRTPPPRSRRGAPATRTPTADGGPEAAPAVGGFSDTGDAAAAAASTPAPAPAPPTSEIFDWEGGGSAKSDAAAVAPEISAASVTAAIAAEPEVAEDAFAVEARTARAAKPKKARKQERRFRQTVQRVDLWSVTKMALCFYVCAMAVVLVAMIALWTVADSAGIIDNVESFIGDLFSADDFTFVSGAVLRGGVLVGIVLVALLVAFTIIAASFYNIFAELFGGVEIVIREEEQPPKR
jgi:hypothetical protein